jgi:quinoprotein glucose dehydrogenase
MDMSTDRLLSAELRRTHSCVQHRGSSRCLALLLLTFPLAAQTDWPTYGHDPSGLRHSPLTQITPQNVRNLKPAWTFHGGGRASEATPVVVNGVMYVTQPKGIYALEPETGKVLWLYEMQGASNRGLTYWPGDKDIHPRVISGAGNGRMVAIDVTTGKPSPGFGNEGFVDIKTGVLGDLKDARFSLASPPALYKDILITGGNNNEPAPAIGAYGDIRGWDARTGKLIWTFHTVPRPGEKGHDTWKGDDWKNRSGVNNWGLMTVDVERGLVFVPLGCPTSDFYGADRVGDGLYGNSLVALDAKTGELKWSRQLVHHDLWDYDLAAAPAILDISPNGPDVKVRSRRAVAQITKMGTLFMFDELTGEPVFGMAERPVPQSTVPGEVTAKTQPYPLKPPALARIDFKKEDLYNLTPEHAAFCSSLWDRNRMYTNGPFTPLGTEGNAVMFPSTIGGGNWNGVTVDPKLNLIVTNVMNLGQWGHMEKMKNQRTGIEGWERTAEFGGSHARFWDPDSHIPCQNPPFGELAAVNANTGDIAWKVPLGTVDELEAKGIHNTGALNLGGAITTASGLVFIAAAADAKLRAFDTKTGSELWSAKLDAAGYAVPITYLGKDGKQYVVITAGGGSFWQSPTSDSIQAFALP